MDIRRMAGGSRRPTTTQVFNLLEDGAVRSFAPAFLTASDGGGSFSIHGAFDTGSWFAGADWFLWMGCVAWDTSAIPDAAPIMGAKLIVTPLVLYNTNLAFEFAAYAYDWGAAPPTSADWRTSPQIQALPKMGHIDAANMLVAGVPYYMESDAGMNASINKAGVTRAILSTTAQATRTQPPVLEQGYDLTDLKLQVTWGV